MATRRRKDRRWRMEEHARNIHVIRINLPRVGDSQRVLLQSDVHWDNPKCDLDLFAKHMDEAREHDAPIIDNGDFFCAMQGKYDKRSNKNDLRPEHQRADYLDALVSTAADALGPYRDLLTVRGDGNHETAIKKNHETCLNERLVERIKAKGDTPIAKGGYSGFVVFQVQVEGTVRYAFKLHYLHGHGGGGPVTRGVIQSNRHAVYLADADIVWTGHCFSDDTEILTPSGWKQHGQLVPGDVVATVNKDTLGMEFQPCSAVHRYDDYTELHAIKANGVDLLVTSKHGLSFLRRRDGRYAECSAEDFTQEREVSLMCGARDASDGVTVTDDELRLIAWIVADGYISGRTVAFHLKKARKIERLTSLMARLGVPLKRSDTSAGTVKLRIPAEHAGQMLATLFDCGVGDKVLPSWMYRCNGHQADVVLEEYEHTDGMTWRSKNGTPSGGCVLYSNDKRNIDILQSLAAKANRRTTVAKSGSMYRMNVAKGGTVFLAEGRSTVVPYQGTVWCVTVPNGTLVVRRNGKVTVTQNTHDTWCLPVRRVKLNQQNDAIIHTSQYHLSTPGYKEEWHDGYGGWHVERGGPPKPVGAAWLTFTNNRNRHNKSKANQGVCDFDITEAK
jgi:hypothetical protein